MVRRSFSHPFLLFSRRRSKDDGEEKNNRRKESLDHTVLSCDESQCKASSNGFTTETPLPMNIKDSVTVIGASSSPTLLRRASKSDPAIRSPQLQTEACQCHECIAIQQHYLRTSRSHIAPNHFEDLTPHYHHQQQLYHQHFMSPPSIKNRVSSQPNFEHNKIIQARIETLEIQQRLLGESHPDVIFSLSSLAKLCQKRGDYEGALSIMRETQVRSMKAKALAYEQQLNKNQQLEVQNGRDEALVPSNISFSNDNSYSG